MNATFQIIRHVLEADEESGVKDIAIPEEPTAGETTVERHGRWKVVDMPDYQFLISFLTPVAYLDKRTGTCYRTSKQWSPTTNGHIEQWRGLIEKSPGWRNDPANQRVEHPTPETPWRTEPYHYVASLHFVRKRQARISALFRQLMPTMKIKPQMKRRMYHVDPRMRAGAKGQPVPWVSGHLKHHPTGEEGLPSEHEPGFREFFTDFSPDDPEMYDWQGSSYRSQEPYEPDDK